MPSRLKQSLYYLLSALRTPLLPETPSTPPTQVPEVLEGNSGLEVTWSVVSYSQPQPSAQMLTGIRVLLRFKTRGGGGGGG